MPREATHPTRDDIDLVAGEFWGRDPHEEMAWMRANAPVYWDGRVWGVTRYADLKAIAKDPATFSNAGGIRPDSGPIPMMIDMDDPAHLKRRKLVNKGFTPRRVREQEAAVRRACDQIIDTVCEQGECDLVTDVAAWLPMIMIGDALGVAPSDRAQLLAWSDALLSALTGRAEDMEGAAEAFTGYTEFALATIADRRTDPRDDLMSVLVHAEVDGDRLDDDEVLHESLLILIGGDETTRHVISGGMYQLLTHPDQRDRLAADPDLMPGAVEEMLRWVSPIRNMARTATRDVKIGSQSVAEGDKLLLLYPSANRDEDVFAEASTFAIDRAPNDHVAFGFGTHFCLGASLARLELTCMVDHLLRRLPDLEVAQDEPAARPANFVSGYEHLQVTFTPTAPVGSS
jgi:cytochrome P450 family 142 subfamily A polypeptide 1